MAHTVDGIKYRTNVLKIVENKKDLFCVKYREFAEKEGKAAAMDFLEETEKANPKKQYSIYLAPKPKKKIKAIGSDLRDDADTLATLGDWKDKKWVEIYSKARDEVIKDMNKTTANFFKSDTFKDLHERYLNRKKEKEAETKQQRQGVRLTKSPTEESESDPRRKGMRLSGAAAQRRGVRLTKGG